MAKTPKFDSSQFADFRQYPVSARKVVDEWISTGIDFSDYARMSTQQHKPSGERRLPTPQWAVNDGQLRELLVAFMEERAGFRKQQAGALAERLERAKQAVLNQRPRLHATLVKLCNEYVKLKRLGAEPNVTDEEYNAAREQPYMEFAAGEARYVAQRKRLRELEVEIEGHDTLLRYTQNDGGAGTIAAVVYLYYRLRLDSVGVGGELSLKPPHVRQLLWRLHETGRKLWPEKESLPAETPFDKMFGVD